MFRSPLTPIFLTVLVDVLAMTMMMPLMPYYAQEFGASPFVVTILAASFAACQFLSGPVLGRVSDVSGRKPTLLVSQIGTFAGLLILGSANSLWMLFLGRMVDGLTAGNLSIAQAYISDVTEPENRTRAFALIGIAFGAGFLVGPAVSGVLAHRFGYAIPMYGAAALSFVSILVTWRLLPEPQRPVAEAAPQASGAAPASAPAEGAGAGAAAEKQAAASRSPVAALHPRGRVADVTRFFSIPVTRFWLLEFFSFSLAFSTLIGGLALFLEQRLDFHVEQTSYVFAFSGLVGGMLQGGMGRIVKRLGEEKLVLVGLASMAVGYALLSVTFGVPVLLVSVFLGAIGSAVVRPSATTLLTKSVGRTEQGAILGVNQSMTTIAQVIGPLVAGWLIHHRKLAAYGLAAGAFACVGAVRLAISRGAPKAA